MISIEILVVVFVLDLASYYAVTLRARITEPAHPSTTELAEPPTTSPGVVEGSDPYDEPPRHFRFILWLLWPVLLVSDILALLEILIEHVLHFVAFLIGKFL